MKCGWCEKRADWKDWKVASDNPDGSVTAYCPHCGSLTSAMVSDGIVASYGPVGQPESFLIAGTK